jgi:multidrug efflux pump subunit AcrA (membrane-fusion protein)
VSVAPAPATPRRTRWWLALGAVAVVSAAAGVAYPRFGRVAEVPTAVATPAAVAARVVGPGSVQARVPVTLSTRINATVTQVQVDVDVGDSVRQGQVLVMLDDRDLSARSSAWPRPATPSRTGRRC